MANDLFVKRSDAIVVDSAVRQSIEEAVKRILAAYPIERIDYRRVRDDEDGDYIAVDLHYEFSELPINPSLSVDIGTAISDILLNAGAARVPDVEHHFVEGQKVKVFKRAS